MRHGGIVRRPLHEEAAGAGAEGRENSPARYYADAPRWQIRDNSTSRPLMRAMRRTPFLFSFCALLRPFAAIQEHSPLSLKIGANRANPIQPNPSQSESIRVNPSETACEKKGPLWSSPRNRGSLFLRSPAPFGGIPTPSQSCLIVPNRVIFYVPCTSTVDSLPCNPPGSLIFARTLPHPRSSAFICGSIPSVTAGRAMPFAPFPDKLIQVPFHEPFTRPAALSQSCAVKPCQTQSNHFFNLDQP